MTTSINMNDRIYYTGDVCNIDGWFIVAEARDGYLRLREQGGEFREFIVRPENIGREYHGHCNPRFVTDAAYMAFRRSRLTIIA